LSYGGTRSGDIGFVAKWRPVSDVNIKFIIPSVDGLIFPGRAGGAGAGVHLSWYLK